MMECPFCAEDIKKEAKKCKHCGEWLDKNENNTETQKTEHIYTKNNQLPIHTSEEKSQLKKNL